MIFLAAVLVFILDRLAKAAAVSCLAQGQSVEVLRNIFNVTLVLNTGTAFGLFKGRAEVFSGISVIVIAFMLVYILRNKKIGITLSLALGLILGGASGNLFDRMKFGYVIDFLDFRIWPVFNLADSAITAGVAILVLSMIRKSRRPFSHNL